MSNFDQPKVYKAIVNSNGRPAVAACISSRQLMQFRDYLLENGSTSERKEWGEHGNNPRKSVLMAAQWVLENELSTFRSAKDALGKEIAAQKSAIAQIEQEQANSKRELLFLEKGIRKIMRDFDNAAEELTRCSNEREFLRIKSELIESRYVNFKLMFQTLGDSPSYFATKIYEGKGGLKPSEFAIGRNLEEWVEFGRLQQNVFPPAFMELCRGKLSQYEEDAQRAIKATVEHIKTSEDYTLLVSSIETARRLEKTISKISKKRLKPEDSDTRERIAYLLKESKQRLEPINEELGILNDINGIIFRERKAAERQFDAVVWFMDNCQKCGGLIEKIKKIGEKLTDKPEDNIIFMRMDVLAEREAIAVSSLDAIRREIILLDRISDEKSNARTMHEKNSPKEDMRQDPLKLQTRSVFANAHPHAESCVTPWNEKKDAFVNKALKLKIAQDFSDRYPQMMPNARQMLESLAEIYVENSGTLTYVLASQRHPQHTRQETGCIIRGHTIVRIGIDRSDRFRILLDTNDPHTPVLVFIGCKGDCEKFMKNDNYVSMKKTSFENGDSEIFKLLL